MSDGNKWNPVDYVVSLLALVVGVLTVSVVIGVIVKDKGMTPEQADHMDAITSAIISIVSMYVGASIQKHKDR